MIELLDLELLIFFSNRARSAAFFFESQRITPPPDQAAIDATISRLVALGLLSVRNRWLPGDLGTPVMLTIHGANYLRRIIEGLSLRLPVAQGRTFDSQLLTELWPTSQDVIIDVARAALADFKPRPVF